MSAPFSFFPALTGFSRDDVLQLDPEESFHLCRVLRLKEGKPLWITDGKGYLSEGIILTSDTKGVEVRLSQEPVLQSRRDFFVHVAIAPTRHPDRLEWFVEKATETGVDKITFIIARHSEKLKVNLPRLQRLALSALKQSQQCYIPEIEGPVPFQEFIATTTEDKKWIGYCGNEAKNLATLAEKGERSAVVIGPEGDFSTEEIEFALHHHFVPIKLGETRLRTETAGWVALHTIHVINQL